MDMRLLPSEKGGAVAEEKNWGLGHLTHGHSLLSISVLTIA